MIPKEVVIMELEEFTQQIKRDKRKVLVGYIITRGQELHTKVVWK